MTWESTLLGVDESSGVDAATVWSITRQEILRRMERRGTPQYRARTVRSVDDPAEVPKSAPSLELAARPFEASVRAVAWFRFEGDLSNLLHDEDLWAVSGLLLKEARLRWLFVWARQNGASLDSYVPATRVEADAPSPTIGREGGLWLLTAEPSRRRVHRR